LTRNPRGRPLSGAPPAAGNVTVGCDPELVTSLPRRVMAAVDGGLKLALHL
jgi:hypothetical protein